MYSLEYEGMIFLAGVAFSFILSLLINLSSKIKLSKKTLEIQELTEKIEQLQHDLDLEHDEKIQLLVINAKLKAQNDNK
jgi:uncharacterized membrane protein YciS (DUF1049 family)